MKGMQIFLSYAHEDDMWVQEGEFGLIPYLAASLRTQNVTIWYDPKLRERSGEDYRRVIKKQIDRSQVALLLISQAFLNSDFIRRFEVPWIMERVQKDEMILILVLVDHTNWELAGELRWIEDKQMLPGSTPLIEYTGSRVQWRRERSKILDDIRKRMEISGLLRRANGEIREIGTAATPVEAPLETSESTLPLEGRGESRPLAPARRKAPETGVKRALAWLQKLPRTVQFLAPVLLVALMMTVLVWRPWQGPGSRQAAGPEAGATTVIASPAATKTMMTQLPTSTQAPLSTEASPGVTAATSTPALPSAKTSSEVTAATSTPDRRTPVALDLSTAVEVRYGDVITEEIKPSGNIDLYTFVGKAGDVAHIAAAGTKDAPWLSLTIQVFDPEGREEGSEFYEHGEHTLTTDGLHAFTVRDATTRTGPYSVVLKNIAPGEGVRLAYGDSLLSEITMPGETHVYAFTGKAGDIARVALTDTRDGVRECTVTLLDAEGEWLSSERTWVAATAIIEEPLATDGEYAIRVRITGILDTSKIGHYALQLQNVSADSAPRLTYGDVVTGTIALKADQHIYVFEWQDGVEILIELEEIVESFGGLHLVILDPQRNTLADASTSFTSTRLISMKPILSEAGAYMIVITGARQPFEWEAPSYVLSLRTVP